MALTAQELVDKARETITEIDAAEAKANLDKYLILDVRSPAEFVTGAIPGALNITRGFLEFKIENHPDFKDKHDADILVYCQTGGRGALATQTLNTMGYRKAVNLVGGFQAWQQDQA